MTLRERWQFVKTLVSLDTSGDFPRLVVHEKYEHKIKWVLRGLALVGIVVGGFSFSVWYYGVGVAILILAVQQFFERVLFEYTAIHVSAMPLRYDPEEWIGVAFAFAAKDGVPDMIGPAFRDRAYAEDILGVMRSWNYAEREDPNNYIRLSFVMENENDYAIYIYPSSRRPSTKKFFEDTEAESKDEKRGKRLMRLMIAMTFCKVFPRKNSLLPQFHERNQGTQPFLLTTFFKVEGGYSPLVDGAILKSSYKFVKREELAKADYEYGHGKRFIKRKSKRTS